MKFLGKTSSPFLVEPAYYYFAGNLRFQKSLTLAQAFELHDLELTAFQIEPQKIACQVLPLTQLRAFVNY